MSDLFGADILKKAPREKKKKVFSMTFYEEDFALWKNIQEHNIFEERKRGYSFSNMLSEGMELLKQKYGELPYRDEKFVKKGGRRNKDYKIVGGSAFISEENYEYYQDFLFYQIYEKRNLEYFTYDFSREITHLLAEKYKLPIKK